MTMLDKRQLTRSCILFFFLIVISFTKAFSEKTVSPPAEITPGSVKPEENTSRIRYPVQIPAARPEYKPVERVLRTERFDIVYSDENALSDFFWRISGKRFDSIEELTIAAPKVDSLLERVKSILDMYPEKLHITIEIYPEYKEGRIASYSYKTGVIKVYADKITDGILAHEMAHAVICNYFRTCPPAKMQEILTQYVDRHLWSDYE